LCSPYIKAHAASTQPVHIGIALYKQSLLTGTRWLRARARCTHLPQISIRWLQALAVYLQALPVGMYWLQAPAAYRHPLLASAYKQLIGIHCL